MKSHILLLSQIEKKADQGYHFDYRRSMLGAWFGAFIINFGLFVFLSLLGTPSEPSS